MRKATTLFSIAMLLLSGCQKGLDREAAEGAGRQCQITISVSNPATRAVGVNADGESAVNGLQLFLFDGDSLAATASSDSSSCSVTCKPGQYRSFILANAPLIDSASIASLSAFRNTVHHLADNRIDSLVAGAETEITVSAASYSMAVQARRYIAKVVVEKVTKDLSEMGAPHNAKTLHVNSVYMTNVVGGVRYFAEDTVDVWYNRMGYAPSGVDRLVRDAVDADVDSVLETEHTFYVLPNPAVRDTTTAPWCPRHTRLVLDATFGGEPCYYVVNMPVIERNRVYRIKDIVIRRGGSDNEEEIADDDRVRIIVGPGLDAWADVSEELMPEVDLAVRINPVVDEYVEGDYYEDF